MIGHEPILRARLARKRPAEIVLVSLVSWIQPCTNPVVYAKEIDLDGDWRFLLDLEVCLIVSRQSHDDTQRLWKQFAIVIQDQAMPRKFYLADESSGQMLKLNVYRSPNDEDQEKWPWVVETKPWGRWDEKGGWNALD